MADMNAILNQRVQKKSPQHSKMALMAQQSAAGHLSSFSGVFSIEDLSKKEKEDLENLLTTHQTNPEDIHADLSALISLTSEVKAINNQAALLHGERIKKAQKILRRYQEGAFSAWLITAYGNRQTPYNFLQYYEFCEEMPKPLRQQIEWMPRQAVYVLASRTGSLEKKQKIVQNYDGETKAEVLTLIRQTFPLEKEDKRQQKVGKSLVQGLKKLCQQLKMTPQALDKGQKEQMRALLEQIQQLIR